MSENENQGGTPAENLEPNKLAESVSSTIPQPDRQFAYNDLHTPENTPMKKLLPSVPDSKKELTEEDRARGFSTVYLGNSKADNDAASELISRWLSWSTLKELALADQVASSVWAAADADWKQYVEQNFPDKSPKDMEDRAVSMYKYFSGLQDSLAVRTRMVREEDTSNVSQRSATLATAEIIGKVPGAASKGLSISEMMTRATLRSAQSAYHYTMNLRNSFMALTYVRPNKLEMADLINNINRRVGLYVREVGGNSVALAYIAGVIEVWNFIKPRIVSSSVKGIIDFADLGKLIRFTDFQVMCSSLLASVTDDGVQMDLRCIKGNCDWHKFDLIDPTKLVRVRHSIQTDEEAAVFGNIFSGRVQYSAEEVLAMIAQSNYGLNDAFVYNEDQTVRLKVAPPSIVDAIVTFEYFVGQVDPKLKEVRNKVAGAKEVEEQITIILNGLGASEFIHWVSEFSMLPNGLVDESTMTFRRSEVEADEFNRGLMNSLQSDSTLNKNLTLFIYNKTPYMTRTFVGLRNYVCPKCTTPSDGLQEEERKLGYTPIDAFMTFFTHTQLMLMDLAVTRQEVTKEARS
ncbi:hypothetical protein D3C81_287380 [compost metagenome]